MKRQYGPFKSYYLELFHSSSSTAYVHDNTFGFTNKEKVEISSILKELFKQSNYIRVGSQAMDGFFRSAILEWSAEKDKDVVYKERKFLIDKGGV